MLRKLYGPLAIIVVGILPVLLLLIGSPASINFTTDVAIYDSIARMAGVASLSLLSLNIILSARLRVFERLFLGLDRAYRFHQLIGGTILILVLIHGALIIAKYSGVSLISAYEFIKPSLDLPLMAGKFGLVVFMGGVLASLFLAIKYQWFILIQRALGLMIFLGGYHALFVSGTDMSSNPLLLTYFILIGGLASLLYLYRSVFHRSVLRKTDFTVSSINVTENISQIWLKPVAKPLTFYAGQFAFFRFTSSAVDDESHPFSISSGSIEQDIRIAVKGIGDYTSELQGVRIGDLVSVEGPYGGFSHTKIRATRQVWIAGGIGITPFLSMASSLSSEYDITLYYCTKTAAESDIFRDELAQATLAHPNLKVVILNDEAGQHLDIPTLVTGVSTHYLLCAPLGMMKGVEAQLLARGVPAGSIHYEEFALR